MNFSEFKEQLDILYNGCDLDCRGYSCSSCVLHVIHNDKWYCLYTLLDNQFKLRKIKRSYDIPTVKYYNPEEFLKIITQLTNEVNCCDSCNNCMKIYNSNFDYHCLHLIVNRYWGKTHD